VVLRWAVSGRLCAGADALVRGYFGVRFPEGVLLPLVEASSPNVLVPVRASRRLAGSGNRVMPMGSPTRQERPSCFARGATAGAQKGGRVGLVLEAASAVGVD
jgi:hypothetical protein